MFKFSKFEKPTQPSTQTTVEDEHKGYNDWGPSDDTGNFAVPGEPDADESEEYVDIVNGESLPGNLVKAARLAEVNFMDPWGVGELHTQF